MASPPADPPGFPAAVGILLDGTRSGMPDELPGIVAAAARELGWEMVVHLVTFDQRRLVPFAGTGATEVGSRDVSDGGAGLAFRTLTRVSEGRGIHWLPLLDGAERVGVLKVRASPGAPDPGDRAEDLHRLAALIGHLVVVLTAYGDTISRVREGTGRTVEAEIIWSLLPPLSFTSPDVVISGLLEPAEEVAGDVFDYAIDAGVAQLAILDATGHDLRAGLLASVALATYRNHRRRGADLATCGRMIDQAMLEHTDSTGYATGVLARLDTATGQFDYLNAGHPRPLLMRGGRVVRTLEHRGRGMFGLGAPETGIGSEQLEPGDRVILYTDGITEARDPDGEFFGTERLVAALDEHATAGRPAPEMLRLVVRSVLDHQHDVRQDDATVMIVEWAPPAQREAQATT